jgi:hypothetical protein
MTRLGLEYRKIDRFESQQEQRYVHSPQHTDRLWEPIKPPMQRILKAFRE